MIAAPTAKKKVKLAKKDNVYFQTVAPVIEPKEFGTEPLKHLIEELQRVKSQLNAPSLTAPQVGVSKRIMLLGFNGGSSPRPNVKSCPEMVILNPSMEMGSGMMEDYETCPNFEKKRYLIRRQGSVNYTGCDVNGNPLKGTLEGFAAREFQHAFYHLFGNTHQDKEKEMEKVSKKVVISAKP